ncbi:MAG: phosphopentomutase [Candidatus Theseobacter exili]|nr:phosphopentomutase [Candidatus Theseobacter exili]
MNRVVIIVLDSVGAGALPDASQFGDEGANTLKHVAEGVGGLNLPNLGKMGLGSMLSIKGVPEEKNPLACFGLLKEQSPGKDTTTGHWELAGVVNTQPFPVYPEGFPDEIMKKFVKEAGRGFLYNRPASGTEIIKQLGAEHMKTGKLIVYTSADSVFQIAAHEEVIPLDELYSICIKTRNFLHGKHSMARVIARPFVGEPGNFRRTPNRRDFSMSPPSETLLNRINKKGGKVLGIGKIRDIFNGSGVSESIHIDSNSDGISKLIEFIPQVKFDLVFANLVDFDMKYGHRNDIKGYAEALEEFDRALPSIVAALSPKDLLIITADHGCDPSYPGTDHTREYVPVLALIKCVGKGISLGIRESFADVGQTVAEYMGVGELDNGKSFLESLNIE